MVLWNFWNLSFYWHVNVNAHAASEFIVVNKILWTTCWLEVTQPEYHRAARAGVTGGHIRFQKIINFDFYLPLPPNCLVMVNRLVTILVQLFAMIFAILRFNLWTFKWSSAGILWCCWITLGSQFLLSFKAYWIKVCLHIALEIFVGYFEPWFFTWTAWLCCNSTCIMKELSWLLFEWKRYVHFHLMTKYTYI